MSRYTTRVRFFQDGDSGSLYERLRIPMTIDDKSLQTSRTDVTFTLSANENHT